MLLTASGAVAQHAILLIQGKLSAWAWLPVETGWGRNFSRSAESASADLPELVSHLHVHSAHPNHWTHERSHVHLLIRGSQYEAIIFNLWFVCFYLFCCLLLIETSFVLSSSSFLFQLLCSRSEDTWVHVMFDRKLSINLYFLYDKSLVWCFKLVPGF